jgi:hypothetical protein
MGGNVPDKPARVVVVLVVQGAPSGNAFGQPALLQNEDDAFAASTREPCRAACECKCRHNVVKVPVLNSVGEWE